MYSRAPSSIMEKKLPVGRRDAITHRRLFFYVPLAMMIGRVVVVVFFFIGRPD